MRSSVVLPAPLVPSSATASPGFTRSETPRRAGTVAAAKGCAKERQPLKAGGKYFSRESTVMAASGTTEYIACPKKENNVMART